MAAFIIASVTIAAVTMAALTVAVVTVAAVTNLVLLAGAALALVPAVAHHPDPQFTQVEETNPRFSAEAFEESCIRMAEFIEKI